MPITWRAGSSFSQFEIPMSHYHLYIDDSGSRRPDALNHQVRMDGMDYFALGGILIREDDIGFLIEMHKAFINKWGLIYPLHSTKIRGKRDNFAWLGRDAQREKDFMFELNLFITSLPIVCNACVVHRPGYVERYMTKYNGKPWRMCKTAHAILIERCVKFALKSQCKLKIFFEESGKHEDRDIISYTKDLKARGMPFDKISSSGYDSLEADVFRSALLGDPRRVTKNVPMVQVSDLVLYAIAKGGYLLNYGPLQALLDAGKLINSYLVPEQVGALGIKYSCCGIL